MTLDIDRSAALMVTAVRDWSLGYGQGSGTGGRWDIRDGGAADCSSLVSWALNQSGITPELPQDTYTGNIRARLTERGWSTLPATTTPQLGDVLLYEGHHVAMCVGTDTLAEAWINELGTATGGTPGDQTGQETRLQQASTHPDRAKWTHLLRPPATTTPATQAETTITTQIQEDLMVYPMVIIRADGEDVPDDQKRGAALVAPGYYCALSQESIDALQKTFSDDASIPVRWVSAREFDVVRAAVRQGTTDTVTSIATAVEAN